jgi:hypothetical protein
MKKIAAVMLLASLSGCAGMSANGPLIETAATVGLIGLTYGAFEQRPYYAPVYGGYYRSRGFDRGYRGGYGGRRFGGGYGRRR